MTTTTIKITTITTLTVLSTIMVSTKVTTILSIQKQQQQHTQECKIKLRNFVFVTQIQPKKYSKRQRERECKESTKLA